MRKEIICLLAAIVIFLLGCKKETPQEPMPSMPVVLLISPTASTQILDTVSIVVEATDDKGVVKVEIYIDNQIPTGGTFIIPPYIYLWNTNTLADSSIHILYAKAYDADANVSSSPVLSVVAYKFMPSGLTANVVSDTLITLSWQDNSRKETGFEIERSMNDTAFVLVKTVDADTTTAQITGAYRTSDSLSFRVRAVAGERKSKYSNVARAIIFLPTPTNLLVSSIADTSMRLSWLDNSNFETSFEIEQSRNGTTFSTIQSVGANITSASVTDTFSVGSTYSYRVRAKSTYNVSEYSNTASATVSFPAPSNLSITSIAGNEIRLRWRDNSSFEKGFAIERSTEMGSFSEVQRVSANITSWNDYTLDTLQTYAYRTRAYTDMNYSAYSTPLMIAYQVFNYDVLHTLAANTNSGFLTVAFSPDGVTLASGEWDNPSNDNTIKLWRVSDGSLIRTFAGHSAAVYSVVFSPDGTMLASANNNNTIKIWRTSDGTLLNTMSGPSNYAFYSVAFSRSGASIAGGSGDDTVRLWLTSDGTLLRTLSGHSDFVYSVAFSPDGAMLASGSADNTVKVWRTTDGTLLYTLQDFSDDVYSIKFSPDGSTFATGSGSTPNNMKLWEASNGTLRRTFSGHTDDVYSVDFSPEGKAIASGSGDNTIKIWRVSDGVLLQIIGQSAVVHGSVAFSPNGAMLASVSGDNTIKVWVLWKEWQVLP